MSQPRRTADSTRPPAVAGSFYPADPEALRSEVERCLDVPGGGPRPAAIIAPHAGYRYSGQVAGHAFRRLDGHAWQRVIVAGPAHFVPVAGVAIPTVRAFRTPLGEVPLDEVARTDLEASAAVVASDAAHAREHSIEVELPFLQVLLGSFPIVPLAVGAADPDTVADVLEACWDDDTLVVLSTDLSHHLVYDDARSRDRQTADAIVARRWEDIGRHDACGRFALRGLLQAARRRALSITELAVANSGDTAGPRQDVVGYGAFTVE